MTKKKKELEVRRKTGTMREKNTRILGRMKTTANIGRTKAKPEQDLNLCPRVHTRNTVTVIVIAGETGRLHITVLYMSN